MSWEECLRRHDKFFAHPYFAESLPFCGPKASVSSLGLAGGPPMGSDFPEGFRRIPMRLSKGPGLLSVALRFPQEPFGNPLETQRSKHTGRSTKQFVCCFSNCFPGDFVKCSKDLITPKHSEIYPGSIGLKASPCQLSRTLQNQHTHEFLHFHPRIPVG